MRHPQRTLALIACVATLAAGVCLWRVVVLEQRIQGTAARAINQEKQVDSITHSWTSGGDQVSVTTVRTEGESEEDLNTRHKDRVDAAKLIWPVDTK